MKKNRRFIIISIIVIVSFLAVFSIIYLCNDKDRIDQSNTVTIGQNGNWCVNEIDTGVFAYGIGTSKTNILTGNNNPESSIGEIYDIYVNLDSWDFYLKVDGTWELRGNVKVKPEEICQIGDLNFKLLKDGTYGVYQCTNKDIVEIKKDLQGFDRYVIIESK